MGTSVLVCRTVVNSWQGVNNVLLVCVCKPAFLLLVYVSVESVTTSILLKSSLCYLITERISTGKISQQLSLNSVQMYVDARDTCLGVQS